MNVAKRIAKNTIVMLIAQIVTYGLGFFIIIYTARYLGAEGFGILSLALALTAIFGIIADPGLSILTVREVSRDKSKRDKFLMNTTIMMAILVFIMFGLIVLMVNILGYPEIIKSVIYIITFASIIGAFFAIPKAIFQAEEKMEYISISMVISSVIMLLGTLTGIYYKFDIFYFAFLYVITNSFILVYLLITYVFKFSLPKFEIDLSFWKMTIKEAWPFGVTGLSGMLYTYIDSILLSIFMGTLVVGWYSAAYRLPLILLFIPSAMNMAIFPSMSRFYMSSKDSLKLLYERYFKYMIILGIPIGVGTTLLADKIILLIFGPQYIQSIIVLQILIWALVTTFAGASYVQLLQAINKQLIITKISGICVIINIIINLVLIPKFSYIGASFATLMTEMILIGYILFYTNKIGYGIPIKLILKDLSKVIFAALIMGMYLWYFKELNLFLLVISGALLYFVTLYIVRGIDEIDINIFKSIKAK